MAPTAYDVKTSCSGQAKDIVPLNLHKDDLSAQSLDLKDNHVSASLRLFITHNVVRRNLLACSENVKEINASNIDAFSTYANYTIFVLEDHLDSTDTILFPGFAEYDERFGEQIAAHKALKPNIQELKLLLPSKEKPVGLEQFPKEQISQGFRELHDLVNHEYDKDEELSNSVGHRVPIDKIQKWDKEQGARRMAAVKIYGHLWCAVYLLKSLKSKERAIFPPGLPRFVTSGMMTAGTFQYRKELQFAPKF